MGNENDGFGMILDAVLKRNNVKKMIFQGYIFRILKRSCARDEEAIFCITSAWKLNLIFSKCTAKTYFNTLLI